MRPSAVELLILLILIKPGRLDAMRRESIISSFQIPSGNWRWRLPLIRSDAPRLYSVTCPAPKPHLRERSPVPELASGIPAGPTAISISISIPLMCINFAMNCPVYPLIVASSICDAIVCSSSQGRGDLRQTIVNMRDPLRNEKRLMGACRESSFWMVWLMIWR